jgi:endonuclease G
MKKKIINKKLQGSTMHQYIIRFFILLGLFFSSLASAVTSTESPANSRVFAYAEANFPSLFTGAGTAGQYQQYLYRYYPASGNYLGINAVGDIFILGPYSNDALTAVGSVTDYVSAITDWEATQRPITDERMFAYEEANLPGVFNGTGTEGQYQQYHYRYYPANGNYLGIDPSGDIFILGPYTGNVLTAVGNVADYRSAILAWEAQPSLRLDYPGFTVWLDCSRRGATKFQYVAQHDIGSAPRYDSFFLDPHVPADCQQTSASTYGMNYDRGHLVPANHLDVSDEAIKATNTMTNILPQAANMNRGAWLQTEEIIECYRDIDELLVIGGVIWGNNPADDYFVQSHAVKTPDAFWKVIIRGTGQDEQAIAWIVPNSLEATRDRLDQYLVTVDELEHITGEVIPVADYAKHDKPSQSWIIPLGCDKS